MLDQLIPKIASWVLSFLVNQNQSTAGYVLIWTKTAGTGNTRLMPASPLGLCEGTFDLQRFIALHNIYLGRILLRWRDKETKVDREMRVSSLGWRLFLPRRHYEREMAEGHLGGYLRGSSRVKGRIRWPTKRPVCLVSSYHPEGGC